MKNYLSPILYTIVNRESQNGFRKIAFYFLDNEEDIYSLANSKEVYSN